MCAASDNVSNEKTPSKCRARSGNLCAPMDSTIPSRPAEERPSPDLERTLFDAKTRVPAPRPNVVTRAPLIQRIRSSGFRTVAVTAPAGYGKSTLLAEWARAEDRPVAWVSLDRFDNEPTRMLTLL